MRINEIETNSMLEVTGSEDLVFNALDSLNEKIKDEIVLVLDKDGYDISVKDYKIELPKKKVEEFLENKEDSLDRYILKSLEKKGYRAR